MDGLRDNVLVLVGAGLCIDSLGSSVGIGIGSCILLYTVLGESQSKISSFAAKDR